jgi:hypothetical protein
MNNTKLKIIATIKNSSLEKIEKESFINFVEFISEKSAFKILSELISEGNDTKKTWRRIKDKTIFLKKINTTKALNNEQKNEIKRIILKLNNKEMQELSTQLKGGSISTKELDNKNKILKKYNKKIITKINSALTKVSEAGDNSKRMELLEKLKQKN